MDKTSRRHETWAWTKTHKRDMEAQQWFVPWSTVRFPRSSSRRPSLPPSPLGPSVDIDGNEVVFITAKQGSRIVDASLPTRLVQPLQVRLPLPRPVQRETGSGKGTYVHVMHPMQVRIRLLRKFRVMQTIFFTQHNAVVTWLLPSTFPMCQRMLLVTFSRKSGSSIDEKVTL